MLPPSLEHLTMHVKNPQWMPTIVRVQMSKGGSRRVCALLSAKAFPGLVLAVPPIDRGDDNGARVESKPRT